MGRGGRVGALESSWPNGGGTYFALGPLGPSRESGAWPLDLHPRLLCPQVLLGHPPPYAVDVSAQVPTVPTPAAILSPPLPEVLPPAAPELLPQLPGSLAPTAVAAAPSLPVQTTTLLPPAHPPLPSGPGITGPGPAVQLTVEPALEVCALPSGLSLQHVTLTPDPAIMVGPCSVTLGLLARSRGRAEDGGSMRPRTALWELLPSPSAVPACHPFLKLVCRWTVWFLRVGLECFPCR